MQGYRTRNVERNKVVCVCFVFLTFRVSISRVAAQKVTDMRVLTTVSELEYFASFQQCFVNGPIAASLIAFLRNSTLSFFFLRWLLVTAVLRLAWLSLGPCWKWCDPHLHTWLSRWQRLLLRRFHHVTGATSFQVAQERLARRRCCLSITFRVCIFATAFRRSRGDTMVLFTKSV